MDYRWGENGFPTVEQFMEMCSYYEAIEAQLAADPRDAWAFRTLVDAGWLLADDPCQKAN